MAALDDVARRLRITLSVKHEGRKVEPAEPGERPWEYDHWKVVLKRPGTPNLQTQYRGGIGHKGEPPTVASVLASLILDADCGDKSSFEEFCSDLGYDEDSRKAHKIWKACRLIAPRIHRFLGSDYDTVAEAAAEY